MKAAYRQAHLVFTVVSVFGALVGCAPKNTDMLHFLRDRQHQVSAIEYRVGIPDGIAISAPHIAEIDGGTHQIQPNGKITLKLLGDVKIVGMTAKEIAAKLEVLLSRYYVDPKVGVEVVGYRSKKYYVYGEGLGAGAKPYTGRDTLLDAVFTAVPNFLAWSSRVCVIRPARDDSPVRTIVVDVDAMLKTGDWSKNILLEPDDVVYVPPTVAAWIGHRVHEILYPIAPLAALYSSPAYLQNADRVYDKEYSGAYTYSPGSY